MDEQTLITGQNLSISTFFKRLIHRFEFGNAPFEHDLLDVHPDFSSSWGLPYDSHPGPISEAITDAKNLHRSLFVFIYCKDNALTQRTINILSQRSVSDEIQRSFLFLPLDVSTPEGLVVANSLNFHRLPLIALVRPRGDTLSHSQIFVKHEGKIGESVLLSYIRIEHHEEVDHREAEVRNIVVEDQDHEYQEALRREQERLRQIALHEEEEEMKDELNEVIKLSIDDAFDALPPPPTTGERATVKFMFPDGNQTRSFPRDGPVSMLFTFARKFVYPKEFIIKAGFPPVEIKETEEPISRVIKDKQFIAYVETE